MSAHALAAYPGEGCGLLLGGERGGRRTALRAVPAENAAADPRRRYEISPERFLAAEKQAREEGLEVVGIFHSHPDRAAEPSRFDRRRAWPYYSYVILAVRQGRVETIRCWRRTAEAFEEEAWRVNERAAEAARGEGAT